MILFRVIVNHYQRIWIEDFVNLLLSFRRAVLVSSRNVKHQGGLEIVCFVERLLNADPVITNSTIWFEANGEEPGEFAPETKPHRTDSAVTRRMLAQEFKRGRCILNRLHFIKSLVELKRSLPSGFRLIGQFNAPLLSPKQVGTNRDKPVRRIPVANVPQEFIDAKDFLQDDNARSVTSGGQRRVGVKLSAIKRFHSRHFVADLRAKVYTRS